MPILSRVVASCLVTGALVVVACSDDSSSTNPSGDAGSSQGGSSGKNNSDGSNNKAGNGGDVASAGTSAGKGGANNNNDGGMAGEQPGVAGQSSAGQTSDGAAGMGGDATGGVGGDGDGAGAGGDAAGGAPAVTVVSSDIKKSITKQISPLDLNDPYLIEVGTSSFFPVTLTNTRAVVPEGWTLSRVEEVPGNCPYLSAGKERCLQLFRVYMYPDAGVCSLTADQIQWSWDVACGAGGDCNKMPTDLTHATFTTTHTSENFCEQDIDVAPFRPQSAFLMPSLGTAPATIRIFTTLPHPYTFTAGAVTLPPGFTLAGFSEDVGMRACDTATYPDSCRQWWNLQITPNGACNVTGQYQVNWTVGCDSGGNCDPGVTTYTHDQKLAENRDLCPP